MVDRKTMTDREIQCMEIHTLFSFLQCSIEHGINLLSFAQDLFLGDGGYEEIDKEALNDLISISKKISSKADMLQNKIVEISKSF